MSLEKGLRPAASVLCLRPGKCQLKAAPSSAPSTTAPSIRYVEWSFVVPGKRMPAQGGRKAPAAFGRAIFCPEKMLGGLLGLPRASQGASRLWWAPLYSPWRLADIASRGSRPLSTLFCVPWTLTFAMQALPGVEKALIFAPRAFPGAVKAFIFAPRAFPGVEKALIFAMRAFPGAVKAFIFAMQAFPGVEKASIWGLRVLSGSVWGHAGLLWALFFPCWAVLSVCRSLPNRYGAFRVFVYTFLALLGLFNYPVECFEGGGCRVMRAHAPYGDAIVMPLSHRDAFSLCGGVLQNKPN